MLLYMYMHGWIEHVHGHIILSILFTHYLIVLMAIQSLTAVLIPFVSS